MKGIVITTENEMYEANFKDFFQVAEKMGWEITEHVKPWGLGPTYCMLIDEMGRLREPKLSRNNFASLMYGTLVHKIPIVGDIVIMKDIEIPYEGEDIVGLDEDEIYRMTRMIAGVWNVKVKDPVDYTKGKGPAAEQHSKPE
jgi:hypothetical protein